MTPVFCRRPIGSILAFAGRARESGQMACGGAQLQRGPANRADAGSINWFSSACDRTFEFSASHARIRLDWNVVIANPTAHGQLPTGQMSKAVVPSCARHPTHRPSGNLHSRCIGGDGLGRWLELWPVGPRRTLTKHIKWGLAACRIEARDLDIESRSLVRAGTARLCILEC